MPLVPSLWQKLKREREAFREETEAPQSVPPSGPYCPCPHCADAWADGYRRGGYDALKDKEAVDG